ncbi:MAG: transcription elongation factor GreA [Beijerinckiaceae bacterium]|nr:transcription elongation factor GreA [Beijerinckiaceae bacterium]
MSVAFVREESAEAAAEIDLPDRAISPYPNLVTPSGLEALAKALADARAAFDAAQKIDDVKERWRHAAPALRDMKYYDERVTSAKLMPPAVSTGTIAFGHSVTFVRDDGRKQLFKIVGEDEADPRSGSISYVSPVARALIGKSVGDVVFVNDHEIEIVAIA